MECGCVRLRLARRGAMCGVLLTGLGLMLSGDRLMARAAGLPSGDRLLVSSILQLDTAAALRALEAGAAPDALSDAGFPALCLAVESGDLTVVRALLARGADPNTRTARGWTPLDFAAVRCGDTALINTLLTAGASPSGVHRYPRDRFEANLPSQAPSW